jgi:hypothetical protein
MIFRRTEVNERFARFRRYESKGTAPEGKLNGPWFGGPGLL